MWHQEGIGQPMQRMDSKHHLITAHCVQCHKNVSINRWQFFLWTQTHGPPLLGHNPNMSELHHHGTFCRNDRSLIGHSSATCWPLIGHSPVTCRLPPLTTGLYWKSNSKSVIFVGYLRQQSVFAFSSWPIVADKWPASDRWVTDRCQQPILTTWGSVPDRKVHCNIRETTVWTVINKQETHIQFKRIA